VLRTRIQCCRFLSSINGDIGAEVNALRVLFFPPVEQFFLHFFGLTRQQAPGSRGSRIQLLGMATFIA
jgi:hypothetical protein